LNILITQVGKKGQAYVIYITTLFFFILLSNFIGLIPYSFTITSHISLTFMLGASSVIGLTIIGFLKQKLHFLDLFVPKGVPKVLLPLLISIEVVSYIARGFSLSIRLFANLMSGHSLIHILLFFITKILKFNFFFGLIGFFLIIIIFLLEIGISFLQAYVFVVLVSIYLKDSFEVGH
jgi:F-type H+-transporting ATPase subunit a